MANSEHLAKLRKGFEAWNQWREEHADIVPELSGARLGGADLTRVYLMGANFTEPSLIEANLGETSLWETVLRNARGLDTCVHSGPSIIDYRTLAKSGPLPLAFLRGCGLPDVLIDYLPSLLRGCPELR